MSNYGTLSLGKPLRSPYISGRLPNRLPKNELRKLTRRLAKTLDDGTAYAREAGIRIVEVRDSTNIEIITSGQTPNGNFRVFNLEIKEVTI